MVRRLMFLVLCCWSFAMAQPVRQPRYNECFTVCTHNSYWVKRSHQLDLFATGTQERLLDQLLFDRARAIEIDIHKAPHTKGLWRVYHTTKRKNVFFDRFEDCLKQLQQFHYLMPGHHPVTIVLELKGILSGNWDREHQPGDLDSLLEAYLGPQLFRPSDLMQRCPGAKDLSECVGSSKEIWPTLEELRGKFIFLILGNFHQGPIGHGGLGWATYGALANPSAFPMQSDFSRFNEKGMRSEKVPAAILERAYRQSVFMQVENLSDTAHLRDVQVFLDKGGIVRGGTAFALEEQQARIAQGYHFLQTDYPWWRLERKGFNQPFQPIDSSLFPDPVAFEEGGNVRKVTGRASLAIEITDQPPFSDWETMPSATSHSDNPSFPNAAIPRGIGCLRAAFDELNYFCICRHVDPKGKLGIAITISNEGFETHRFFEADDVNPGAYGDLIRMTVENNLADSTSIVTFYTSAELNTAENGLQTPKWNSLIRFTFKHLIASQGVYASRGDVLFVGTKLNGNEVDWEQLGR